MQASWPQMRQLVKYLSTAPGLETTPCRKMPGNLEMMVFNRNLLFQGSIFRFHVCFGWCICLISRRIFGIFAHMVFQKAFKVVGIWWTCCFLDVCGFVLKLTKPISCVCVCANHVWSSTQLSFRLPCNPCIAYLYLLCFLVYTPLISLYSCFVSCVCRVCSFTHCPCT